MDQDHQKTRISDGLRTPPTMVYFHCYIVAIILLLSHVGNTVLQCLSVLSHYIVTLYSLVSVGIRLAGSVSHLSIAVPIIPGLGCA